MVSAGYGVLPRQHSLRRRVNNMTKKNFKTCAWALGAAAAQNSGRTSIGMSNAALPAEKTQRRAPHGGNTPHKIIMWCSPRSSARRALRGAWQIRRAAIRFRGCRAGRGRRTHAAQRASDRGACAGVRCTGPARAPVPEPRCAHELKRHMLRTGSEHFKRHGPTPAAARRGAPTRAPAQQCSTYGGGAAPHLGWIRRLSPARAALGSLALRNRARQAHATSLTAAQASSPLLAQPQADKEDESIIVTKNNMVYHNEDAAKLRSRLLYQSRKRGIKENDLLFGFVAPGVQQGVPGFAPRSLLHLQHILEPAPGRDDARGAEGVRHHPERSRQRVGHARLGQRREGALVQCTACPTPAPGAARVPPRVQRHAPADGLHAKRDPAAASPDALPAVTMPYFRAMSKTFAAAVARLAGRRTDAELVDAMRALNELQYPAADATPEVGPVRWRRACRHAKHES